MNGVWECGKTCNEKKGIGKRKNKGNSGFLTMGLHNFSKRNYGGFGWH